MKHIDQFIDLTHLFEKDMSRFGNFPEPKISPFLKREESLKYYAKGCSFEITEVNFVTSLGTYLDAPFHRYEDGKDISALLLNELIMPGILIDLSNKKSREAITRMDIEDSLSTQKGIGMAVLIWTGWDKYWKTEAYKAGPYLDESAAKTLLEYNIKLVGVDTLNIDDFQNLSRPVHSILLNSKCLIIENLKSLDQLKGKQFEFSAIPLKMKGATSFPVRAFARIENNRE